MTKKKPPPPPPSPDDLPMSRALSRLTQCGVPHHCARGRKLIKEGESGQSLYIVLSGELCVYATSADDERNRYDYAHYSAGDFVGEMSLDGQGRTATVEVLKAGWMVLITRETLDRHLRDEPDFAFELLSKVINRARVATAFLKAIALHSAEARVVWWLRRRALEQQRDGTAPNPGPGALCRIGPVTHNEIARQLACDRSVVTRALQHLEQLGYVRVLRRFVEILKDLPGEG